MSPKAFISYSHDSDDYKDWVRALADNLIRGGVEVTLDQYDLAIGQMIPHFMEKGISENDFVILLVSQGFARKARDRTGGVGFEVDLVTGEIVVGKSRRKYIPVLVKLDFVDAPAFLKGAKCIRITNLFSFEKEYAELYQTLTGQTLQKPTLGKVVLRAAPSGPSEPFDVLNLGSPKNLTDFCYLQVRFDASSLNALSVAELYSAIRKHTVLEDIHGYLRAEPPILTPAYKKSNAPEVVYESPDYACSYTNVMDYDKLIIGQGMVEYSFISYRMDRMLYFSSEIAQDTLLRLLPILERAHQDINAAVDIDVTVIVRSSTGAAFLSSGRPLPVKWQMMEHYVHAAGTTSTKISLRSIGADGALRLFNRVLEGFVSTRKESGIPFLQVDEKVFPNVYKEYLDRTP